MGRQHCNLAVALLGLYVYLAVGLERESLLVGQEIHRRLCLVHRQRGLIQQILLDLLKPFDTDLLSHRRYQESGQ